MSEEFDLLKMESSKILAFTPGNHRDAFFIQEMLRFHSIAGTIEHSFQNVKTSVDERILTHILMRSLLENFFRILYIFDSSTLSHTKFDVCVNGFKIEYAKLHRDPILPHKSQLEPADPSWPSLEKPMDLNSMLATVMNSYGVRLNYIYFVYRVSSFDTHGNSLEAFFDASFRKKPCNFPVLDIEKVTQIIADEYLRIWNNGNLPP
ncbi:hypothetical protein SAMN05216428_107103 [Nitrosospira sp. Nsp11]|uniref:hypothetical protein n=1 Tax=Nitrosospira sp. Nsp11 TaxID=1855338 RepID=UPI00091484E5|nr:hypothetical protein [Nitrosospira sp. Nsp11]SHL85552.1 hypothetical protein SAMN05216428_107103 [Nitrosospira sp. Nsp11]